jgi:fucose 4-O-acetylase-like acetyltransferase
MFYVFFMVGCLAAHHMTLWEDAVQRWWGITFAVFVITVFITIDDEYRYLLAGMASIPALHGLIRSTIFDGDRILLWLGRNVLTIYLFNTIFIGLMRGVVSLVTVPSEHMVALFALSLPVGLLGPVFLRYLLTCWPATRRVVPWIT